MGTRSKLIALLFVVVSLAGCAMARHREQVREGFLTRGLHRGAFLEEWGPPSRTFAVRGPDAVLRTQAFGARWERPVYAVWEYQTRATCLTFDGVRLISWETEKSDCTPKPGRESADEARQQRRQPPPFPPYSQ